MLLNEINKLLIIRLSSLGDIILTTPLVRTMKQIYPHIKIDFCLREQYEDVYKFNPHISKLIHYEENPLLIDELRNENYDFVLDLQNNLRSKKLRSKLKAKHASLDKRSLDKFLLVKFKRNRLKNAPEIPERYAQSIDMELDNDGTEIFIQEEYKAVLPNDENIIAFCPGSRHFSKMWPEDYFLKLGKILSVKGIKVAIMGGLSDRELCRNLSSAIPGSIDLSNDNNLLQTAAEMSRCKAVVCNDSGLMHVASAMKIPVCVIMGSSVKEFGFYPYKTENEVLENEGLYCRPCSHIGKDYCPEKHFRCMLDIHPVDVYKKLEKYL